VINAIKFSIEEIEASDQYFDHTGSLRNSPPIIMGGVLMFRSERMRRTGARSSASGTSSPMQSWADCITGTHESSFWKRQVTLGRLFTPRCQACGSVANPRTFASYLAAPGETRIQGGHRAHWLPCPFSASPL